MPVKVISFFCSIHCIGFIFIGIKRHYLPIYLFSAYLIHSLKQLHKFIYIWLDHTTLPGAFNRKIL